MSTHATRRIRLAAAAGMLLAATVVTGVPAVAARGGGGIIRTGNCTASTDWKLKAKADNGRIEVEFEVDSNRNGQTWNVRLQDNGVILDRTSRTTQAPSGSFEYRRLIANRAGTDHITAFARNRTTGETCSGALDF
jgi:hypothetical protein